MTILYAGLDVSDKKTHICNRGQYTVIGDSILFFISLPFPWTLAVPASD